MIKLNDDTIIVGQIKQLLKNFNLPRCYIGDRQIGNYKLSELLKDEYLIDDNKIYFCDKSDSKGLAIKKELNSYIENDKYLNITTNLDIVSKYYDIKTHRYLGDYLRFLRDYHNINLMSMYNCSINKVCNKDIIIQKGDEDNKQDIINWKVDECDIYIIPVKAFYDYSIALCGNAELCYCLYDEENDSIISPYSINDEDSLLNPLEQELVEKTLQNIYCKDVSNPVLFSKDCLLQLNNKYLPLLFEFEKTLRILIKVPKGYNKSIVVLEGDFTLNCNNIALQDNNSSIQIQFNLKNNNWKQYDFIKYITQPQLTSLDNYSSNYLLADRLIEYLVGNVICPLSESYDIKKLQEWIQYNLDNNEVISKYLKLDNTYPGIWSDEMTYTIIQLYYNYCSNKKYNMNTYYDFIGYCDKTMEDYLNDIGIKREYDYGGIV